MPLTLDDLSLAQREYIETWSRDLGLDEEELLAQFNRDQWMPDAITGPLPHCGLFGLMEADGRCHT